MDSADVQVLRSAQAWCRDGHRVALATVVRTWGSAPRREGALLAVRGDGRVEGSVSGGCVEDDLIRQMRERPPQAPVRRVDYGVSVEEARRFGLPCGGTLQLVIEELQGRSGWIDRVLAAVDRRELCLRHLDLRTAECRVEPGRRGDAFAFDGERLSAVHGPAWRLLLVGAGQTSRCLAQMASAFDYEVTVCDPRPEYDSADWGLPQVTRVMAYPDDAVLAMEPDPRSAIVTLTHDPRLDDAALMEALKSPAFYVGALGSRRSSQARRERLRLLDLSASEVARLHAPVGLAIGSRTPPEIAVAILAELTAERHRGHGGDGTPDVREAASAESASACSIEAPATPVPRPQSASA